MATDSTPNTASSWLILGGARSGKSCYAETLARESGKAVCYIATAQVFDDEIAARVTRHQQDRPAHWTTIEEPISLASTFKLNSTADNCLLVDCLTMWIMNLLELNDAQQMQAAIDDFLQVLPRLPGDIILVSNELGMGVIPMGKLSRDFVDEAGRLHQQIAQVVSNVHLIVAGLPMKIKEPLIKS